MKIIFYLLPFVLIAASCKINPDSNRNYTDKNKVYKLNLNPNAGSKYSFEITNESELKMEVDDKESK